MRDNLKIPYGVSDFKRVISEGYYYIDKSALRGIGHRTRTDGEREPICLFPDKSAPSLSRGTMLHQIVFQFKGTELVRCEHVAEDMLQ